MVGSQVVWRWPRALQRMMGLLQQASSATLDGLPAATKRWWQARRLGLTRVAVMSVRTRASRTRALVQKTTERAPAVLTPRHALAPQRFYDGQPLAVIAARLGLHSRQHHWAVYQRLAVRAVSREFLAKTQAEFPPNWSSIGVGFPCHCSWKGATVGRSALMP